MRFHHRDQPGPPPDRKPAEKRVNTISVDCGATGPLVEREYDDYRQHCLGDVKAWVDELYRLGATDDLPLPEAEGLGATLDVKS